MNIPLDYIIDSIYKNCKRIKNKANGVYMFECPICLEGKSRGKKRRGYFFSKNDYFYCQNCQRSWRPIDWILKVRGISFKEMIDEIGEDIYDVVDLDTDDPQAEEIIEEDSLPRDCINLNDPKQVKFYNNNKIVKIALDYIRNRRLDSAINRPNTFYLSLTDYTYRNRLCIPFYDENNNIIYYQARALLEEDQKIAKYLSKRDEKSIYGINNITDRIDYIFIFEGPIDSMFCQNGVGLCGLNMNPKQKTQLDMFRLFEKIWVLDNQSDNSDVMSKYKSLIEQNERVFIWPKVLDKYKDLNEMCMSLGCDFINPLLFIKNSYKGIEAEMKILNRIF